jgi:tetratricopeptide (TPR) repeat protein
MVGLAQSEKTAPSRAPAEVRVGQGADFTRIEFHFAGGARASHKREGDKVILRFNRNARPDISQLRVFPPKWLKTAESRLVNGGAEVTLTLAEATDYKVGQADGATFVNLFDAPKTEAAETAPVQSNRPNPVPDNGVVKLQAAASEGLVELRFPWKAPLGAAVFRRGEAVWVVFDAKARLDLSGAPKISPQMSKIGVVNGADYVALRIASPATVPVAARAEGGTWTVSLGASNVAKPGAVTVGRDSESEAAGLSAAVSGASRPIWISDGGDRFAAIPALGPAKGMPARRQFVDLALLSTAQGLAIEPRAGDLSVTVEGDIVRMAKPRGLALSSLAAQPDGAGVANAPQPAAWPGLIDFDTWPALDGKSFYARYDELQDAAAAEAALDETTAGKTAPKVQSRMALARFLVGSELSFEAIGALNLLAKAQPQMLADPEFRGLRGAARAMSGRYAEAELDLTSPALIGDPAAALWRGYIASRQSHWEDARKAFSGGYMALNQVAPNWRARFARADAEAAVNLGQIPVARTQIAMAYAAKADPQEDLATSLVHAQLWELEKDNPKALAIYDQLARTQQGELAAAAILRATQIRFATRQLTAAQAVEAFDGVRYRWRGDATEIEATRALGRLYQSLGKYREALEVWRSAGRRQSDLPQYQALQTDIAEAFRYLFLDGAADGMEPIQSLALFWDFKNFTPISAEGDFMVRRMARRLVDVDLLDQAAFLLDYQVNNRLDGVAKAQVATDLALVHLMNRKPEQALVAINSSRTTVLPAALNTERRMLTARALMGLGRFDDALEIIETDKGPEADEVRAELAWRRRDWPAVGPTFEKRLGDRWKDKEPLGPEDEARLLRAAIGFSLGEDDAGLARLRDRYTPYVETARAPEALRIALSGIGDVRLTPADFSRIVSEGDTFAAWVARSKQRFREKPAPVQTAKAPEPKPIPPNVAPPRPQPKAAPAAQAAAPAPKTPAPQPKAPPAKQAAAAPPPPGQPKAPAAKG